MATNKSSHAQERNGFTRLDGTVPFLGYADTPAAVYEWRPLRGHLVVRFISPLDGEPRRFYLESTLRHFTPQPKIDNSLEKIIHFGCGVLNDAERHDQTTKNIYRLAQHLFRNRMARPTGIDREFADPRDFVAGTHGSMEAVVPGLAIDPSTATSPAAIRRALQLATLGPTSKGRRQEPVLGCVLHYLTNQYISGPQRNDNTEEKLQYSPEFLAGNSFFDGATIDGLGLRSRPLDFQRILDSVRSSLIFESDSVQGSGTLELELQHRVIRQIGKRINDPPAVFDKWLARARSRGFTDQMRLGKTCKGPERNLRECQGRKLFADLLWLAYQLAARCYGGWLFLAYLGFVGSTEISPSEEEQILFRHLHFRQVYLAGLPLAFLPRPQTQWTWPKLYKLWYCSEYQVEAYDSVADLLGLYGMTVRQRRAADLQKKRSGSKRAFVAQLARYRRNSNREAFESELTEDLPILTSLNCPDCKAPLNLVQTHGENCGGFVKATVNCPGCDSSGDYRCDLQALLNQVNETRVCVHGPG